MYNVSRCSQGSAPRASGSLLAEKGMYLDQLRSQGYCIVERLADDLLLDRVNRELEPWFGATPRCRGDFYGWNTTRFGAVLLKSRASHDSGLASRSSSVSETSETFDPPGSVT